MDVKLLKGSNYTEEGLYLEEISENLPISEDEIEMVITDLEVLFNFLDDE